MLVFPASPNFIIFQPKSYVFFKIMPHMLDMVDISENVVVFVLAFVSARFQCISSTRLPCLQSNACLFTIQTVALSRGFLISPPLPFHILAALPFLPWSLIPL
jgi:hypothetical protein